MIEFQDLQLITFYIKDRFLPFEMMYLSIATRKGILIQFSVIMDSVGVWKP